MRPPAQALLINRLRIQGKEEYVGHSNAGLGLATKVGGERKRTRHNDITIALHGNTIAHVIARTAKAFGPSEVARIVVLGYKNLLLIVVGQRDVLELSRVIK